MTRIKGISVLLLETPLTRSKYIFPTHTHTHTTSYTNIGNLLHIRVQTNPSLVENPGKNPKKTKREPDGDDDDFLEDLVVDTETAKQPSYSTLKQGDFVTKAEDRKERLEKRRAKRKEDDDDDDDDKQETEQEKLEREAGELSSQLKKAERAEAQAQEKDQKDKAKRYSQRIRAGSF